MPTRYAIPGRHFRDRANAGEEARTENRPHVLLSLRAMEAEQIERVSIGECLPG